MSGPGIVTPAAHNELNIAPRFCAAEGCGLTVAPGAARCWIHKPAGPDDTKEGQLR